MLKSSSSAELDTAVDSLPSPRHRVGLLRFAGPEGLEIDGFAVRLTRATMLIYLWRYLCRCLWGGSGLDRLCIRSSVFSIFWRRSGWKNSCNHAPTFGFFSKLYLNWSGSNRVKLFWRLPYARGSERIPTWWSCESVIVLLIACWRVLERVVRDLEKLNSRF